MSFINIQFNAFISRDLGKNLKQFYINDPNLNIAVNKNEFLLELENTPGYWNTEPASSTDYFKTDDRRFNQDGTHRLQLAASIDVSKIGTADFFSPDSKYFRPNVGESHQCEIEFDTDNKKFIFHKDAKTAVPSDPKEYKYPTYKNFSFSNNPNNPDAIKCVNIQKSTAASYPFLFIAPNIDMSIKLTLFKDAGKVRCFLTGIHNLFPYYELICNGKLLYTYDPSKFNRLGPDPFNLNRSMSFNKSIIFMI